LVLGFPLYFFTFPALVKNMLERLLPAGMPWLVPHPAEPQLITHPPRDDKTRRLFIVSTAGLPGRQHFYSLVQTARQIALMAHIEYAGHILCPAAEALRIKTLWFKQRPFFNAVRQAGIDLVREGSLSEQTQKRLEAELMPGGDQAYIERANAYWIERMARHDITAEPPPEAPLPKKYRRTTG